MKISPEDKKIINTHLICWGIYISYEVILAALMKGQFSSIYYYILFYALNISLFYTHAIFVMPNFLPNVMRVWYFVFLLLLEIVIYFLLTILLSHILDLIRGKQSPVQLSWVYYVGSFYRATLFIIFGSGYYFLSTFLRRNNNEMRKAVEIERLQLRLVTLERDFLRSQINPHLFFNTLNFVKYAAKKDSALAEEAILRLSEIMSFALDKNMDAHGSLTAEVKQAENIIRLNQMRFADKLKIRLEVSIDDGQSRTLPLILLTMVENMFKHGDLNSEDNEALIEVRNEGKMISYRTKNLRGKLSSPMPSTKKGLENISSRLNSIYPVEHTFRAEITDNKFFEVYVEFPKA
ncbi:sensor histidine kinase [Pedobacter petrophilus]